MFKLGCKVFINVDFPTPECPEIIFTLPFINFLISDKSSLITEVAKQV